MPHAKRNPPRFLGTAAALLLSLLIALLSLQGPAAAASPSMSALTPDPWVLQGADRPVLPADWQTVHSLYINVHHHPTDRAVALALARHAATSLPNFADRLDLPTGGVIDLYLADTQDQFNNLQPGTPPTWADGTAWPLRGMIFLRAPDLRGGTADSLDTVLDHELIHVLIGRAFRGQRVPRWLQEGVAQVYARQYTSATTDTLASGLLGNDMMSLKDLSTGFPADPVRARLAYAQSADLVAWLQNEHGPDAVPTIIHQLALGTGFGAAVRAATGQRVDQVDQAWRSRLASSGLWFKPLVSDTVMFSVGAVVLIFGYFGVRRRNRIRLDAMDAEERARDTLSRSIYGMAQPPMWMHPRPQTDSYLVGDSRLFHDHLVDPSLKHDQSWVH